jgi:hypothetical protein
VTQLEPRTQHQPEKLKKLSKNDLVVLLLILKSTKSTRLYLIYFQLSAACPQQGDRIWCNWKNPVSRERQAGRGFSAWEAGSGGGGGFWQPCRECAYPLKAALGRGSGRSVLTVELVAGIKIGRVAPNINSQGVIA